MRRIAIASVCLFSVLRIPAFAAEALEKRLRLVYAEGVGYSGTTDVLYPLETALRLDFPQAVIEKIELLGAYYSQDSFLVGEPGSIGAKPPMPAADRRAHAEIAALETPISAIWASSGAPTGLLDKVFLRAREVSEGPRAAAPGIEKRAARSWENLDGNRRWEGVSLSSRAPGRWSPAFAMRYHLSMDGKRSVVTMADKPLGEPGRIRRALENRRVQSADPELPLSIGGIGMLPEFGLPRDILLKNMVESGFKVLAFAPVDIEHAWDELTAFAKAGQLSAVCTNLQGLGSAQKLPFSRYHVAEAGSLKVGIISLIPLSAQSLFSRRKLPYEIVDPTTAAQTALRELRAEHKVDLVVAVSHLSSDDELYNQRGIDVFISDVSYEVIARRKVTVELSHWSSERHSLPALRVQAPSHGFGEVEVVFQETSGGRELLRLVETPFPAGPDAPEDERLSEIPEAVTNYFVSPKEALLPDARNLWPGTGTRPRLMYQPHEFWNLAASILRRETRAEAALLRIKFFNSDAPGELSESFLRNWLSPDQPVVLARLSGADLRHLRARIPFDEVPLPEGAPRRLYHKEVWLAASGLDRQGRVSGVPISDSEYYTVAASEELFHMKGSLPELQAAREPRPHGERMLSAVVLEGLKHGRETLPPKAFADSVRAGAEGRNPVGLVWRLNLRELSLEFASTQVEGTRGFSQVRDARVQAINQLYTAAAARLFSELYWNRWRWDTGFTGNYGRITLRPPGSPPIVNTTKDQLIVETEARHRTWSMSKESLRPSVGPFLNIAYDTEFVKPENRPKREFVRYKSGLKLFDGSWLKEFYAGGLAESDYSAGSPGSRFGYASGLALEKTIPGTPVHVKAEASYAEFARSSRDTAADLKRRLDINVRLNVPLMRDLRLSPFVSYYLFEGAKVRATGYNILFGVSLDYSRLWKPFH